MRDFLTLLLLFICCILVQSVILSRHHRQRSRHFMRDYQWEFLWLIWMIKSTYLLWQRRQRGSRECLSMKSGKILSTHDFDEREKKTFNQSQFSGTERDVILVRILKHFFRRKGNGWNHSVVNYNKKWFAGSMWIMQLKLEQSCENNGYLLITLWQLTFGRMKVSSLQLIQTDLKLDNWE